MNFELDKLADVPTALDIVKGEVLRAQKAILDEGKKSMDPAHMKAAKEAIAYAERMETFVEKIDALGSDWDKLLDRAEKVSPEAREIVRRAGVEDRKSPDPKTNLEVTFPDGTVVHEAKANLTLGKVVEIIGPGIVAALTGSVHFRPNGEPLVTRNRSDLNKYPSNILKLKGGWYLNTQTDTDRKAETVKAVAKALKLKLKVKIVPGTYLTEPQPTEPAKPETPAKPPITIVEEASFPYKIGKVVQAVFSALQNDSRMTLKIVDALCKQESAVRFKTAGHPVLKLRTGKDDETRDRFGYHRYYPDLPLRFFGKRYWLTSQFYPRSTQPVFDWLKNLGFTRDEVLRICTARWKPEEPKQGKLPL